MLESLRNGDNRAWGRVYASNWPMISKLVLTNNGTAEDAKDLYQEAFSVFHKKISKEDFELTSTISTYLYSISRNLWLKVLSKRKKTVRFVDVSNWIDLPIIDEPDEWAEIQTMREKIVIESLSELSDPCFEILKRFYYNEQSMEQIAAAMNYKNTNTAKNQKHKCLKKLRAIVRNKLGGR